MIKTILASTELGTHLLCTVKAALIRAAFGSCPSRSAVVVIPMTWEAYADGRAFSEFLVQAAMPA